MNLKGLLYGTIGCCITATALLAQTKKPAAVPAKATAKQESRPKPVYNKPIQVFLGNSDISGGTISKQRFDELLKEGLTAKDSAGSLLPVSEFWFLYKERNLYEDSAGRYYIGVDLLSDFNKGSKVNNIISANLYDRTKGGDTALFYNIWVLMPDSIPVKGVPLELVLTK